MSDEILKSCPFCGGVAELWERAPGCFHIACRTCFVRFPEDGPAGAIASWNRRALPDREALVDVLMDMRRENAPNSAIADRILSLLEGKQ